MAELCLSTTSDSKILTRTGERNLCVAATTIGFSFTQMYAFFSYNKYSRVTTQKNWLQARGNKIIHNQKEVTLVCMRFAVEIVPRVGHFAYKCETVRASRTADSRHLSPL